MTIIVDRSATSVHAHPTWCDHTLCQNLLTDLIHREPAADLELTGDRVSVARTRYDELRPEGQVVYAPERSCEARPLDWLRPWPH